MMKKEWGFLGKGQGDAKQAKAGLKPAKQKPRAGHDKNKKPISNYFHRKDGPVNQGFGDKDSGAGIKGEDEGSV